MKHFLFAIGLLSFLHGCTCSKPQVAADGGCNAQDLKSIKTAHFGETISACSKSHFFGMISGVEKCLTGKYQNFSDTCGKCYGELSDCTKDNCLGKCISDPTGDKCRCCSQKNCIEGGGAKSFLKCSGLNKSELNLVDATTCSKLE